MYVFSPRAKARKVISTFGTGIVRNMETLEPRPFHRKDGGIKIKAKSKQLSILVEELVNVGTITIQSKTIELPEEFSIEEIADIKINTIPDQEYYLSVRKREEDFESRKMTTAVFTAIHE
ncbi:hypothetical protein [Flavobacterium sp. W21_SRS_FM6]|uniref:hypothetical protein n=1 Tax=Flavobacterium sp. W21_SRS_FM6 TaxID=3240268 RepID=UPI003F8FA472